MNGCWGDEMFLWFVWFVCSVDMDNTAGKLTIFDTGKGMDSTPERSISKWYVYAHFCCPFLAMYSSP
jgi:hypothetical protein